MPDISYQMQLLKQQQDPNSESSPMGAMRALGTSIGNAWQGYEAGKDEKDLVDFFTKEDTTPEKMQEFMVGHPRMPQVDVYTKASMIGRQKKAKVMKDASAAAVSWLKNQDPKAMTMEKFQAFSKSLNLPTDVEFEFIDTFMPKIVNLVKSMRPEKPGAYTLAPGAKRMKENLLGGPDTEVAYNPEDRIIDIYDPATGTTAKIPTSHFDNEKVPEWKGWKKGTPTKEVHRKTKMVKGTGRNLLTKEFLEGEKEAALKDGWREEIPLYPPEIEKSRVLKGFDKDGKRKGESVYTDPNTNKLVYEDGTPYTGGQLQPVTEPSQVTVLNQSIAPADMETLADAIESGRTTMATVAKGMGGAHTARAVSVILEGRGVNVANLEANLTAKRSALNALEKTVNQLKPFEETARKNLNYAKSISHQYMRTRYPDINKLIQMWDSKTGDPLIEKFKIATYDGMMESMKHMLAGSGITAAELSVGAQKKADELLSTMKSWEQFDAIIEGIDKGLVNRSSAYADQLKKLKAQPITAFEDKPVGDESNGQIVIPRSKQKVMTDLRNANPGTPDAELEAYAKKKGYF